MAQTRPFIERLKHGWNAFLNKDTFEQALYDGTVSSSSRPDRTRLSFSNEKSIVSGVYTRIAIDAASVNLVHARVGDDNKYLETIDSCLNNALTIEANIDQTGRALVHDIVLSLIDEGCVAVVPIDTSTNPKITDSYDIQSLRVAKILEWHPSSIKVRVYNDRTGQMEDVRVPKKMAAIIENPLYAVMNSPNSTLKRLVRKLNLLDAIDEQSGSGKLDIIIQLPYAIRSKMKKDQADARRNELEAQLKGSKYGIGYTDGTEKITQLNRPAENNLMVQITYLTSMLYGQLGMSESVFNGTADEKTMLNYYNRTIDPILSAITEEMRRKFLTKTARTQKQTILYIRDLFKLVPIADFAEMADKLTRNEIATGNEMRGVIGFKPSPAKEANELRNKNVPAVPASDKVPTISEPVEKETTNEKNKM